MATANLFNQVQDMNLNEAISRYERIRENLILGKKHLFDSGKFTGQIAPEAAGDFEVKWNKLTRWLDEHEVLIETLSGAGVDRPEWHCVNCRGLVTIPWTRLCQTCATRTHQRKLEDMLARFGWAPLACAIFGGEVILTLKSDAVQVPDKHKHLVSYTLKELKQLRFATTNELQMFHKIKKLYGGRIQPSLDPKPNYENDSEAWEQLLTAANETRLYGPLHGFRCYGAKLEKQTLGWQIVYCSAREGFKDQQDFDEHYTLWLSGHKAELKKLLDKIEIKEKRRIS